MQVVFSDAEQVGVQIHKEKISGGFQQPGIWIFLARLSKTSVEDLQQPGIRTFVARSSETFGPKQSIIVS